MAKKLFVGSLPWETTSDELGQLFAKSGQVVSAVVITDKATGRSRGFGFVEMEKDSEADAAIKEFNGYDLNGRKMVVAEAKPREEGQPPRRNF